MRVAGQGASGGEKKLWAAGFEDEIRGSLKHDGRGVLSMANKEVPGTNGSQFFFTYAAAAHLNGKHSVFGRVVGNLAVLDEMEAVRTDKEDKPRESITITKVTVYVDPFEDAAKANRAKLEAESEALDKVALAKADPDRNKVGGWYSNPTVTTAPTAQRAGVGKYLSAAAYKND